MNSKNIFRTCMLAVIVFVIARIMFRENLEIFNMLWQFYACVIGASITNEVLESLKSKRGIDAWWMYPTGVGLGVSLYMVWVSPAAPYIHVPLLIVTSLTITMLTHHIVKHQKSKF